MTSLGSIAEKQDLDLTCETEIKLILEQISDLGDVTSDLISKAFQKIRLEWNYHSNAIEGNRLTYGETVALIMHGVTAKGKSLKDHLDVKGHNEGIDYMLDLIKNNRPLSHNDIRELHRIILKEPYYTDAITPSGEKIKRPITIGSYKTMPNHVRTSTGEMHYYVEPQLVQDEMTSLLDWYNNQSDHLHPIVVAAIFHHRFVAIHPFDDGNGRLGRILMNFILIRHNFPPVVISYDNRDSYYGYLSQADVGDFTGIIDFICQGVVTSLKTQLTVLKGENVDSLSDIDKEIALFKAGLKPAERGEVELDDEERIKIAKDFIIPLAEKIDYRFNLISELYKKPNKVYLFRNTNVTGKPGVSDVSSYKKWILETIDDNKLNFISFQFSYLLDSYKLDSNSTKMSFDLFFELDNYLFIFNAKVPGGKNFDFVTNYSDKEYYSKIGEIAENTIKAFMSFTRSVAKK